MGYWRDADSSEAQCRILRCCDCLMVGIDVMYDHEKIPTR